MPKYTDAQKQKWAEQRQQQLSAITDMLEQGVSEVFTSEKYISYHSHERKSATACSGASESVL